MSVGLPALPSIDPAGQLADQRGVFFAGKVWAPFTLLTTVHHQWHILVGNKAPRHSFIKHTVHG